MKLAEYIARSLKHLGVDIIFTVSAESILPLLKSLIAEGVKIINARYEPSVGFMALVYSRITRKPGIAVVTSGPGAFGVVSPVAMALVEGDPMIIIATVALSNRGTAMHQLPDDYAQLEVFKPITKASFRITRITDAREIIEKSFNIALSNKPGPVYIEIPHQLLEEESEESSYPVVNATKIYANTPDIKVVADLLSEANYPVIIAGRGIYLSGAEDLILKMAELLTAPIATTVMSKGLIPSDHFLYAGVAAGRAGNRVAYEIIEKADVILAIGNRFSEIGTGRYSLNIKGTLIHVNIDPRDLGRAYKPAIAILSDAKYFLSKLLEELNKRKIKSREYIIKELKELWDLENKELETYYSKTEGLIKPWEVIRAIRKIFDRRNTIFIGDVGAHRIESFLMPIYRGELYITTTSYVSMGLAVPGSVASSIVYPDRDVVGIVGDGGFLMTGLEVSTAVQYNAKPKIVVFNDSAYRVLGVYEKVRYKSVTAEITRISHVNFAELAKSLGAEGLRISERSELESALREALDSDRPSVIDVFIDPSSVPIPFQRLYKIFSL